MRAALGPGIATVVVLLVVMAPISALGPAPRPLAVSREPAAPHPVAPTASGASIFGSWSTYLQNPERTAANLQERTLSATNASQLSIRWKIASNGSDFGSPTILNGTVYAGSWDGYEYALNASTGHILWKTSLGTDPGCTWGNPMGVAGNAAVWNGTVYVGGGDGYWYALSAGNGTVDWKIKVGDNSAGNFDWASPLLADGYEYIGVASCIDSPLVQGKLLMVNLTGNHSVVHTFDFVPSGQNGATVWTTPAWDPVADLIWVATGNDDGSAQKLAESIVALRASNLSLVGYWQVPGVVGADSDFGSGPTLFHDASGRMLVGATNKNGDFYALNRSNVSSNGTWKPVWHVSGMGGFSNAAFDGTTLYLGGAARTIHGVPYAGSVFAVDPANGSTKWIAGTVGSIYGALAYANGLVAAGAYGSLQVLDAANGTSVTTLAVPSSTEIEGAPSIAQGRIFFESGNAGTTGYFFAAGIPLSLAANASPSAGVAPLPVQFTSGPAGGMPPYNYSWSLGDGNSSFASSPAHTYTVGGTFNVSVTVRDAANATRTANLTVNVTAPLVAQASAAPLSGLAPLYVTFSGSAHGGAGPPFQYAWNFSDGSPDASGTPVRHQFVNPGVYPVRMTLVDSQGRSANQTLTIRALAPNPPLAAQISASPLAGVAPLNVTLSAEVRNGTPPYSYAWGFGDGSPAGTGATVTHLYSFAGNFSVSLQVTDTAGGLRVAYANVSVSSAPAPLSTAIELVQGSTTGSCAGAAPVHWVNVTAVPSGGAPPYSSRWDFGDGSAVVTGANANHSYAETGTFTLRLTTVDSTQAVAENTSSVNVAITPPPCPGTTGSSSGTVWVWYVVGAAVAAVAVALVLVVRRRRAPPPVG